MARPGDPPTFPGNGGRDARGWQVLFIPKARPERPRTTWKVQVVERDPDDERRYREKTIEVTAGNDDMRVFVNPHTGPYAMDEWENPAYGGTVALLASGPWKWKQSGPRVH